MNHSSCENDSITLNFYFHLIFCLVYCYENSNILKRGGLECNFVRSFIHQGDWKTSKTYFPQQYRIFWREKLSFVQKPTKYR
jgi:hypothetical protein